MQATVQTLWVGGSRDNAAGGRHGSKMSKIVVLGPSSAVLASQGDNAHRESSFSNSILENFDLQPSRNFTQRSVFKKVAWNGTHWCCPCRCQSVSGGVLLMVVVVVVVGSWTAQ